MTSEAGMELLYYHSERRPASRSRLASATIRCWFGPGITQETNDEAQGTADRRQTPPQVAKSADAEGRPPQGPRQEVTRRGLRPFIRATLER